MPNNLKAIDLTVIVATDGMDDETAYTKVRDYLECIELRVDEGVRATVYKGETRQLTKHELAAAKEDPKFIDGPFDEHD